MTSILYAVFDKNGAERLSRFFARHPKQADAKVLFWDKEKLSNQFGVSIVHHGMVLRWPKDRTDLVNHFVQRFKEPVMMWEQGIFEEPTKMP